MVEAAMVFGGCINGLRQACFAVIKAKEAATN